MSRKPKRRASRVGDSLIAITLVPGPGVVQKLAAATAEARELAAAKRRVERALRAAGMPKNTAVRVLARMTPEDILAEAERLAQQETPTAPTSTPPPRPWGRFWSSP